MVLVNLDLLYQDSVFQLMIKKEVVDSIFHLTSKKVVVDLISQVTIKKEVADLISQVMRKKVVVKDQKNSDREGGGGSLSFPSSDGENGG